MYRRRCARHNRRRGRRNQPVVALIAVNGALVADDRVVALTAPHGARPERVDQIIALIAPHQHRGVGDNGVVAEPADDRVGAVAANAVSAAVAVDEIGQSAAEQGRRHRRCRGADDGGAGRRRRGVDCVGAFQPQIASGSKSNATNRSLPLVSLLTVIDLPLGLPVGGRGGQCCAYQPEVLFVLANSLVSSALRASAYSCDRDI